MISEDQLNQELNTIQYLLLSGSNRTFTVEMVDRPDQERTTKAITKESREIENKFFTRKVLEFIEATHPHAIRIFIFEKNSIISKKVLHIIDDRPVLAFGEKAEPTELASRSPIYYDEATVQQLKQQVSALQGLMEKSNEERQGSFLQGINDLKKEHEIENLIRDHASEKKDWQREKENLEEEIEELNNDLYDLENENKELKELAEKTQGRIDNFKQIGLLAGLGWLKGAKPESMLQLAGLFLGDSNPTDLIKQMPTETGEEDSKENKEDQSVNLSPEELQRKKNEASIYSWMKSLDHENYLRFAHLVDAISARPNLFNKILKLIVKDKENPIREVTEKEEKE